MNKGHNGSLIHSITDTMHSASSVTVKLSQSHQTVACVVGYKFLDCFGIDIWNISTGSCQCYLPFGQYGQLLQMEVKWIVLWYIYIYRSGFQFRSLSSSWQLAKSDSVQCEKFCMAWFAGRIGIGIGIRIWDCK